MKHYLKNTNHPMINIETLWPALRQRQYYNAMCDLKHELEVLAALPNIDSQLKEKVTRSLDKIRAIILKMSK
jgi:hypothetical protein